MDMLQQPVVTPEDNALVRGRRRLGAFELTFCSDGTCRMDGGAMFGVVPKTLWSKRIAANEANQVLLGLNTVVVRTGAHVVLIESGIGNKQPAKMQAIHQNQARLMLSLEAAGVSVDEVTHVVNTHLHFDHCGWNTTLHEDGSVTPTFRNAMYFAAAGELAHGRLQLERDRVSYLGPNYDPLIASGQMTLIDLEGVGEFVSEDARLCGVGVPGVPGARIQQSAEIVPGVWVENFPGHTKSMLAVHVESEGQRACYVGDLIPTHHHLDVTWVMGFDLDPLRCIEERKKFLARAIEEKWLVMFPHDHQVPFGFVEMGEKGKAVLV